MRKDLLNAVATVFLIALWLISFSGTLLAGPATVPVGPRTIMIIRHAEKPDAINGGKNPDLTDRGYQRADALVETFSHQFPKPDFLFATKRSKGSNRPVETITPLSKVIHEQIDSRFADDDIAALAQEVLNNPKYSGKVVLIAWHHGMIPQLAKALGVMDVPPVWDSKTFDRVWQINYENGVATWKDLPEKALPGDSEKVIDPPIT